MGYFREKLCIIHVNGDMMFGAQLLEKRKKKNCKWNYKRKNIQQIAYGQEIKCDKAVLREYYDMDTKLEWS